MAVPLRRLRLAPALIVAVALAAAPACARKSGCPVNESAHREADKDGKFKKGKSKSELFPKDMRRRMGGG